MEIDKVQKNSLRDLCYLMILCILTIILVYSRYLSGKAFFLFSDMGSDCVDQFYPMYVHIVNQLKSGELTTWSFQWGLGCDTLTRQDEIMDPFALITIFAGVIWGTDIIKYMLIVVQIMKVLICSLLAYKFLGFFKLCGVARVLGAYVYGFNAHLMLWGQHYQFGAASVYMVLVLIMVEIWLRRIKEKRPYLKVALIFSFIIGTLFLYSIYIGYMILISTGIYALLRYRYILDYTWKTTIKHGIALMASVFLGLLLSAAMILPFCDINFNVSERLRYDSSWSRLLQYLKPYGIQYYLQILSRMISNNLMGTGELSGMYYEMPQFSVSVIGMPIILQGAYACFRKAKKKCWIYSGAFLVFFVICIPLGSCILNGWAYPFGRYTFILMPIFALLFGFGVHNVLIEKKVNTYLLIGSTVLAGMITCYSLSQYESNEIIHSFDMLVIVLNLIVMITFLMSCRDKNNSMKKIYVSILVVLCFVGCFTENYITNSLQREVIDSNTAKSEKGLHGNDTIEILNSLQNNSRDFFRIEKMYADFRWLSDSLLQNYCSGGGYCSTINENLIEFYDKIAPEAKVFESNAMATMMGMLADRRENGLESNVWTLLGIKYLLNRGEINVGDGPYKLVGGADIKIYENQEVQSLLFSFDKIVSEAQFEKLSVEKRDSLLSEYLVLSNEDVASSPIKTVFQDPETIRGFQNDYCLEKINSDRLVGKVSLDHDSYVFAPIPYRKGWNIYVDGISQEIKRADYGFMAVYVLAGDHEIEICYENSVYKIGMVLTVIGSLIWLFLMVYAIIKPDKNCKNSNTIVN